MELNLENKLAFISGSSKGIGKAIALALAREKVNVAISGRRLTKLSDIYKEITDMGVKCLIYEGDIRKQIKNKIDLSDFDILINNVGGYGQTTTRHQAMDMNYEIMVDLIEPFLGSRKNYGRVITISSIYGKEAGHNPYFTAAKSAQIAFMKSLAGRYEEITFNTICPGHIDVGKSFPYKPKVVGQPEDVANLVTFLCSDKAKHINGACITVDGGESHSF